MKKLGDSHNFGKFVFEEDKKVYKPRELYWEFLFLSKESPLRDFIHSQSLLLNIASPFSIAPDLHVTINSTDIGYVQKLSLEELKNDFKIQEKNFADIGALLALCFWFGIGDLHRDNIKIGLGPSNNLICFPIDIENIFDQMTHLQQTLLLPSDSIGLENCGFLKIWDFISQAHEDCKIKLILSFINSINLYNLHAKNIIDIVSDCSQFDDKFIRIIPRDTKTYNESIVLNNFENFYESEKLQLLRNEIPYFIRRPSSKKLYYFSDKNTLSEASFETSQFNLPTPVALGPGREKQLIKIKTAILSVSYLAELFKLRIESKRLGHVNIYLEKKVISVEENNDKINYLYY
jgi:lantibiotic modifying enzyme